jgi:hypothetical protein
VKAVVRAGRVPGALPDDLAVHLLPSAGARFRVHQGKERALDHGNVGPLGDLQEAQDIGGLLIDPAVAGDDGEA